MPVDIGPALEASRRKQEEMATWSVDRWQVEILCETMKAMKCVRGGRDTYWREKLRRVVEDEDPLIVWADSSPEQPAPAAHIKQPAPRQRTGKGKGKHRATHTHKQTTPDRHWRPGDLLTVEDAVRFTHRHEQTVRNWYRSGALQVLQPGGPGGAVLIPFENLLACLRRQEASA